MSKYETLQNVLNRLRLEAPSKYTKYRPSESDTEKLNQALARAYIHLYLKVNYGILDFEDREKYVTDGTDDGGIDAYYIDEDVKMIYLIQSKYRINEKNFDNKEILLTEILKMDADRISRGEKHNEEGKKYNGKIQELISKIGNISNIGRWDYRIIVLANLRKFTQLQLKKLTGGFDTEVFNQERTYKELVFPVITGTYYNNPELKISINLSNIAASKIEYNVETKFRNCAITVLFVPTKEIAKTLYKYKNSILQYNPRCFLDMQGKSVNNEIAETVTSLETNEFSLYNNGITMLSYDTVYSDKTGQKNKAQLVVTKPQIINGGQTAYTLSRLYEDCLNEKRDEKIFEGKEVLLKVITFYEDEDETEYDESKDFKLIETISKATNQQNTVDEADRRANDHIQIKLQKLIFNEFGYLYERKRGEFGDGIRENYIDRNKIIKRELFMRLCKACDFNPADARRSSVKQLFDKSNFDTTLNDENRFKEYFFAYQCYERLLDILKSFSDDPVNKFGEINYGNALRYGRFAVVTVARSKYKDSNTDNEVNKFIKDILSEWTYFEKEVSQKATNNSYFRDIINEKSGETEFVRDFDGYYKGKTLNNDLADFFGYKLPTKLR